MESETRDPFAAFRTVEALQSFEALQEEHVKAAQAIMTAMQPLIEAINTWWYSLPAHLRRTSIASSQLGGASHTRHAMRARKIGRVVRRATC